MPYCDCVRVFQRNRTMIMTGLSNDGHLPHGEPENPIVAHYTSLEALGVETQRTEVFNPHWKAGF